jgi:DNA adenine methylase
MENKIYRSPLFYVGDKYKLIDEIKKYFPPKINCFIEPFAGGGSVFLNTDAKSFILNDIDKNVYNIHEMLTSFSNDRDTFFKIVIEIIKKYKLSRSFETNLIPQELKLKYNKTYYAKFNKVGFSNLKNDYNRNISNSIIHLYILLIYGFNRMLRFNSKGEYNLPVGNVDFNKNVFNSLNDYFTLVNIKKIIWNNLDYIVFLKSLKIKKSDLVYFDPPYLITFSEYNKLWNEEKEIELLAFIDQLNTNGIRFAISNIVEHKGRKNQIFLKWSKKYNSRIIKSNYINYHDNSIKNSKELLVTNYK